MAIEIGHHAEFVVPQGTEIGRGINDREHHLLQAIATFLAGLHGAAPEVPIGTGDQIELVTMAARVGDVGIAVAAGCEAHLGGLHLQHEGAPGGPHHAIPQPRDGMIDSTVHARPAETSITGISGPSATRNSNFATTNATQATPRANPGSSYSRAETVSPTVPPSGPRGYVSARGGGYNSRGRGGWGAPPPRSHFAPAPVSSPATPPTGPSAVVPTGPRASISSVPSPLSAAASSSKPFNPPTGPAAQGGQRMTLAQNLINSMPPIIPGGKADPASTPLSTGVTRDLEAHHRRLKEEEERIREELRAKDEKLRRSLRMWERLERESKAFELKSDLSERSLKTIAGEGLGGAAF
ncbi:hypothetical protein VPNG_01243 [Cytospora leucostoma]|uniref:Uncharacterized protein n=1 Tax=Cytospora leucostoma TaxID=1230097 RepID=A0A423XL72_9PEZI|nr:hypothetical protein VPNG_01243 [Cytospora leucostoma]